MLKVLHENEIEKVESQKNLAIVEKNIAIAENEKNIAILKSQRDLALKDVNHLTQKLLSSEGLLTSRGVFENYLAKIFSEASLKGKFNATMTLQYLAKTGGNVFVV